MRISAGAWGDLALKHDYPADWTARQVGELADVIGGGTPSRGDSRYWSRGAIPWATPTDITSLQTKYLEATAEQITDAGLAKSSANLLPVGSVLFTSRATIGAKAISAIELATNQGFASLVPKQDHSTSEYLYYLSELLTPNAKRLGSGTTFLEVSKRDLRRIWCVVPGVTEQAAIARVLDGVDTAMAHARTVLAQAEALRLQLIRELLTRGIDHSGSTHHLGVSTNAFSSTKIGRLPREWVLSNIDTEFDLQTGFTLNSGRQPVYLKRPYLRVANVQRDAIYLTDVQELEASDVELGRRLLQVDDLLVVEGHADRMQIGRCAIVRTDAVGLTYQNHLYRLRSRGKVKPAFACLWLNSEYAMKYWNSRCATSSGLNTINQRMLRSMRIPVVPPVEQDAIIAVSEILRRHWQSLVEKHRALAALKSSLIHDLLSGKIRIRPSNQDELTKG